MDNVREMCSEVLVCLDGLSVFSGVCSTPVIKSLQELITVVENANSKPRELIKAWASFSHTFVSHNKGRSFFMYWTEVIMMDENPFTLAAERGEIKEHSVLTELAHSDLRRLAIIGDFDIPMLALHITDELWRGGYEDMAQLIEKGVRIIGELKAKNFDLPTEILPYSLLVNQRIEPFVEFIKQNGAGTLGKYNFFYWKREKGLVPALYVDEITLASLSGYEKQREIVINNTKCLLEGKPANNILLYGDRGTGKSATVKAVCNEYKDLGLRLVEVSKQDLSEIPHIMTALGERGLKFVLFIDDLSFERQNDDFMLLKALLEGGIESKPKNVVVYATSNRRHFVRERPEDRPSSAAAAAGDMRMFDTIQEQLSLADRFGVTVVYSAPSQEEFIKIAEFIADKRRFFEDNDSDKKRGQFRENALRWERWFNGRSPRTARQYVDWVEGGAGFPWEA
ncbi:MAG: ATP-binding protein [Spirochaetaceae bacterium]|jgi:predicted AAA+ superfamily ATPase|nr:ATP-binding protein [Spirochaetaceae bacterium]